MKLGKTALLEIVAIVADGLANGKDISEGLRKIDLGPLHGWENTRRAPDELELTQQYVDEHPRSTDWEEDDLN